MGTWLCSEASRALRAMKLVLPERSSAPVGQRHVGMLARSAAWQGRVTKRAGRFARQTPSRRGFAKKQGKEYQKHLAFRRDNNLLHRGVWKLSRQLLRQPKLPPMSDRQRDLLHILWLLLEQSGQEPGVVDQAWDLSQSIVRQPHQRFPLGCFTGLRPSIPGLRLVRRGAVWVPAVRPEGPIAPCVMPHTKLWINSARRFASGAELLQLQGIDALSLCAHWQAEKDSVLRLVAGNAFTLPVAGWYLLLAMISVCQAKCAGCATGSTPGPGAACAETGGSATRVCRLVGLPLPSMARALVELLLQRWPTALEGCHGSCPIALGTLCSGANYIGALARALATEMNSTAKTLSINLVDEFACEKNAEVAGLMSRQGLSDALPRHTFPDVHCLPLGTMADVDVLIFGSSCKSLSHQNVSRRSLLHCSQADHLSTSGATMSSCLAYVSRRKPSVCIIENVSGMLDRVGPGTATRNVDIVLQKLEMAGYMARGFDVQDPRAFFLPQSRKRVYVWASLLPTAYMSAFSDSVRQARPNSHLPLRALLLE